MLNVLIDPYYLQLSFELLFLFQRPIRIFHSHDGDHAIESDRNIDCYGNLDLYRSLWLCICVEFHNVLINSTNLWSMY